MGQAVTAISGGQEPKVRHIRSHTGLRGIAALLVVLYHLQFGAQYRLAIETATPLFSRSYLFVDLFFILSGFIISYTNDADRWPSRGRKGTARFYLARWIRIYPLHIFCLSYLLLAQVAITVLFAAAGRSHGALTPATLWDLLLQALLLQAWLPQGGGGWNIPSWSISAEICAYLCFPLLAGVLATRRVATTVALLTGAAVFYAWIAATTGNLDILRVTALLRCMAGFSLGMIAYAYRDAANRVGASTLTIIQVLAVAGGIWVLATTTNDVMAIPAFFLLVASTWTDKGIVSRWLCSRPLQALGEISYSIYLNHVCLITICGVAIGRVMARVPPGWLPFARTAEIAFYLVLTLIVSALTYRFVEKPCRRMLYARLIHRAPATPADMPTAP